MTRRAGLFVWAFASWFVLTWSVEAEQLVSGAVLAATVALGLGGLGDVARPWAVLAPRRVAALARLAWVAAVGVVKANLSLAPLIWRPRPRPRSGMVVVPTDERTDGGVAWLGLLTSLAPENQLVDLDRRHSLLQYHTLRVEPDTAQRREAATGPVERAIGRVRP